MHSMQSGSPMIGRDAELDALADSFAQAAANMPQAVMIGGEAGLGKTRLVREFLAGLPGQARTITGQCVDLGALAPPYAPITGVLRSLAAQIGMAELIELAGPGREALALLLPEAGPAPDRNANGNRVLDAVMTVLERSCADVPTVMVVEDLHWADDATLTVLRFILRALAGGCFLLVMTYRTDDIGRGHPLRAFLSELERGRQAKSIRLERLTKDQVRDQVEAITGKAAGYELLENMYTRSEGVPFFVEELLGLPDCNAADELPSTLQELLLARYDRLDEPVQYFLRAMAAGGVNVLHSRALAVYDRTPAEFEASARAAQHANLLRFDGTGYAFRHALVREAIHADLLPGERNRFHTRYAEVTGEDATARRESAEIAYHWRAANLPEKTFAASVAAMGDAECSYAYSTAASMGEQALELWERIPNAEDIAGMPRFALMARTASAHNLAGSGERSLAVIRLAIADGGARGPKLAALLADQSRYLGFNAREGSIPLLLRALELVPAGTDEPLRAGMLNRLAARYMLEANLDQAILVAGEAMALAEATKNAAEQSVAANLRGVSRIMAGELDAGLADIEAAEPLALGDPDALLRYRVNYSDILHLLGRYDDAVRVAEEGIARARERGVERTTGALLSSNAVEPLFARGDWLRAAVLLERNLALSPPATFLGYLLRSKTVATLWAGKGEEAESLLRRWQPLLRGLAAMEVQARLPLATVRAEVAWVRGDLDDAWRQVSVLLEDDYRALPGYDLPLLAVAARVLAARRSAGLPVAEGDEERLRALAARDCFWPTYPAWQALFDAELSGSGGTGDDAVAWGAAARAGAALPAHLRHYVTLRRGMALHAGADRPAAVQVLRSAIDDAGRLGAGLVVNMARDFAQQTGLVLDGRSTRPHDDSLTSREEQVLSLVAEGLSNKAIGGELFISDKTVSVHVSAIMRKLGVSSRTEAAAHALKAN
ncbi:MAG: AAA family ATPase [Specibacter sp.]